MAFTPTAEQKLAINEKGSILVSAAAGSGKTAVLVERVIRMLTDNDNYTPADKLLIVTFTNAAAAELRYRIEKRIALELDSHPEDVLLQRQRILLSNAKICTIDSFCIDFIRENFEESGVNPTFKIADRATILSLQISALSQVINKHFDEDDQEFLNLLRFMGDDFDDSKLRSAILRIFEYSRQIPFPSRWLDSVVKAYEAHSGGEIEEWFDASLRFVLDYIVDAVLDFEQALELLKTSEEAYMAYGEVFCYYLNFANSLRQVSLSKDWDKLFSVLDSVAPPKSGRLSSENKTKYVLEAVKLRDKGKQTIDKLKKTIYATKTDIKEEIGYVLPYVKKINQLVCEFEKELYKLFEEKNLLTFYMAEQTAFAMLAKEIEGEIVESDNAKEYIERFDAILVDEYQDTNSLQDMLFHILSDGGKKLFCVGDIKQSIYRFRGSNPVNFLNKKNIYSAIDKREENEGLRIDLGCNFRSRKEICDYINSLFGKIIYKENSDFDYDKNESLVAMANFPESDEIKVENHFIDFNILSDNSEDVFEARIYAEAAVVADRIIELMKRPPFLRDGDSLRKAEFKDFTILLRSMQSKGDVFIKALKDKGIPVSVSASDIVGSDEVNTLLSFLKVINNPSDDVALLTVMTSAVFSFTMDELAEIRVAHRKGHFISAVISSAKNGNSKAEAMLKVFDRLRYKNIILPLGKLIDEIFEETNLLNIVSISDNGDVKRSNLVAVQNAADSFEAEGRRDLASFINFFNDIDNNDFNIFSSSGANSVSVMSIHKSKGLQFPICILANTTNQFNISDTTDQLILSENRGESFLYYDELEEKKNDFILRTLMKNEEKRNMLAEELRICYVALTRAEEKLIIVSSYNDLEEEVIEKGILLASSKGDRLDYPVFRKSKSYADWIMEALILDEKSDALLSRKFEPSIFIHREIAGKKIEKVVTECSANEENIKNLKEILSFKYPFAELLGLESKASVTELVHKADIDKFRFTRRPSFMYDSGLTSAEKGTAVHKVMQYADIKRCREDLTAEINRLYENLFINDEEYDAIDINMINKFLTSELCDRILNADSVKREMKFITEFPTGELYDGISKSFENENIIVQGAIDLLFVEKGQIVIVDFKTDRNKDEKDLISCYSEQLKLYAKACSKLLKMPIKELILYSFSLNKSINVEF